MTVFYLYSWILLLCLFILPTAVNARRRWQFPKLNLNPNDKMNHVEDTERLSALWYEQAVTGLMAVMGTRLQQQLSPTSVISRQLENCASKAENSIEYARCLSPVIRQKRLLDHWRKHRQYRKRVDQTKKRLRYSRAASESLFYSEYSGPVPQNPPPPQYPQNPPIPPSQPALPATQGFLSNGFIPQAPSQYWPQAQSFSPDTFGLPFTTTTEKPLLVEIADWLTDAVRYVKANVQPPAQPQITFKGDGSQTPKVKANGDARYEPKEQFNARDSAIDDTPVEGFVKRLFAPALFGNRTAPEAWTNKHFSREALLSNVTVALDNFVKTHRVSDGVHKVDANEIVPTWQIEFLEDVHHLIMDVTHQAQAQFQQQQDQLAQQQNAPGHAAVKILSPRLLPLESDQQQYDAKFLSPDILSFTDEGIASIPRMLGATVGENSREAWLRFIMEASGAKDILGGDNKMIDMILKHDNSKGSFENDMSAFSKVYDQVFSKFEQTFKQLYSTFTNDQISAMEKRGYAYLSRDQIDYMYHSPESPCAGQQNCSLGFDLDHYEKMSEEERDEALMDFVLELANAEIDGGYAWTDNSESGDTHRRSKRTLVLTPVKFMPIIRMPSAISMPIILSPILFSPVILSPSVLGPIVLSPAIFSPVILSPLLLGILLLSPFVGNPVILSPLCLFPIILSPLVLNPFILCPYVLTPIILSPLVLSPAILDPNALSPLILDPGVLSPIILGPHVLSPIILSPQAVGALILSPGALSPIIASPVAVFAIILSPQVLG